MRKKLEINTGDRYGRLTIVKLIDNEYVECRCDCGTVRNFWKYSLTRKNKSSKSCGCISLEINKVQFIKHGDELNGRKTTEYSTWDGMKQRCTNPNHRGYMSYGGRGITICDRWLNSFQNFLEDMGRKPSRAYSIDRIDVNGNYELSNCRWATSKEQAMNKRNSKKTVNA